jgi:hypothetical protein
MSINWNASRCAIAAQARACVHPMGAPRGKNHRIRNVRRVNFHSSVLRFGAYASAAFSSVLLSTTGGAISMLSLNR